MLNNIVLLFQPPHYPELNPNERLRRKRTEYHFAPLPRFAAQFCSAAPLTLYWKTQQIWGDQPSEIEQVWQYLKRRLR